MEDGEGDWNGGGEVTGGEEDNIRSALLRKKGGGADGGDFGVEDVDLKGQLAKVTQNWKQKSIDGDTRNAVERWLQWEEKIRAPWRRKLAEKLESTYAHTFIVGLLLIDLLATAIDILKTMHNKTHDLDSCVSLVEQCVTCIGHFDRSEEWEWTYWISIVILIVLLLNVFGLFVAFGVSFFVHPGYILDLVVVVTALSLEVFLDADTAGLLIILTLWRIVRVAHGIFEVTDEAWENDMHKLEAQIESVQAMHDADQLALAEKDRRIAELETKLSL